MFCGNCGTENTNNAKFCKNCGKPLGNSGNITNTTNTENVTNTVNTVNTVPKVDMNQVADKLKAVPKKTLIGICAAAVVLIIVICVAVNAGNTINLNKYLMVETTGYDGYGTARVSIDWDAIEEKYGDKISFTSAAKNEYGGLLNMMTPMDALQESVRVELEESSGLSNGAEVAYTWKVDEDLSKYVKCKIKYKDNKITVTGLTEVGTFDAFAGLTVEFSGIAPNGQADLNYTGSEMNYYDFSCDKTSGLSNGDTIKVTIDGNRLEYYAENLGKVPETLEREYKVEGLARYLAEVREIDDAALAAMQQQAEDAYRAYAAQNWGEGEALESFTYMGNYLLTAKDQAFRENSNYLFLVYKAQIKNQYSNDGNSYDKLNDDYWYIRFDDLMVGADGIVNVDVTRYSTPRDRFMVDSGIKSGWWSTKTWYYYGYESLENLYKAVVTSNMDLYNHEDNMDESVAPESIPEDVSETGETGYVFPNSSSELLSRSDLEGMTAEECKIARNEIYARHGRKFRDEELQAYFNACDWYEGTIEPDDFKETDLNEIEIANKDLIVAYEEEKGYR